MWDYTKKVKEHFLHPKNVGEIKNADGTGQVGSLVCGDALKLTLKIDKKTDTILDVKFKTFGCASAIASSSILTELVKGKKISEVKNITNKEIAKELGGLPEEKMHCSVMGMEALEAAIKSYQQGGKPVIIEEEVGAKIVCQCFGVTEEAILKAIHINNLKTVEDVTHFTKAGGACGKCKPEIQKILDKVNSCEIPEVKKEEKINFKKLTMVQKIKLVEKVLNEYVLPKLNIDRGSAELIDIVDNKVKIRMLGACSGCVNSGNTIKNLIEKVLKEKIDKSIIVEQIK